ncbi:hypothetical protein EA004_15485 [Vibrio anguillarum]|uniref:Uncharacterized protein n=3 Tax=Vibrio anguillarum TaxID=55601 RepID=A0ABR9ZBA0_VIBAN|nr:hypothetical protein [Vibrio anguillarum]MBF4375384.1 hypothetical protein [Vibrio anguillarum]
MSIDTASVSIVIATISMFISFYVMWRDRRKFIVHGEYLESWEHMADGVYFKIVNSGRRPVTLHKIEFISKSKGAQALLLTRSISEYKTTPFEEKDLSYPCLSESQFFEFALRSNKFDFSEYELSDLTSIKIHSSTNVVKCKELAMAIKSNHKYLK